MDPRFLGYYNRELQYLRELGGEFAREFPKIAGRLALDAFECADPYVERLLEGFAFLAARVQLKIDAEFPRFTENLLQMVYPHYLQPTPSMAVVELRPSQKHGALAEGFVIPRGTALRANLGKREQTACEYRTAHAVTLWPLEIVELSHSPYLGELGDLHIPHTRTARASLRLKLRSLGGIPFEQLALDDLPLFVRGSDDASMRLYELLLSGAVAIAGRMPDGSWRLLKADPPVAPRGFTDEEALLPTSHRSFQGYRLLHEYFALPSRYAFAELRGLSQAVRACKGNELEIAVILDRHDPVVESTLGPESLALFCTPAINLFPRTADRIHLTDATYEYHVVPDRTRPLDLEVHSVTEVTGFGAHAQAIRAFEPFYAQGQHAASDAAAGYYTLHRRPRLSSAQQRQHGPRSSYLGGEVFISLVDGKEGPYASALRQLSVGALCTNRDLPLHMTLGEGKTDFRLESGAPIESVRVVSGPSAPRPSPAWGELTWRFIGHLSLNYLSISEGPEGATALRELLQLYGDLAEPHTRRQIEGIRSVRSAPVVRRVADRGAMGFARGLTVTLECDEGAFEGSSMFLLGAVLDRFFAKYVSINSFTETVLRSTRRGEVMRWPHRLGLRTSL
jgi:type VI secretion system protein ImpG